MAVLRKLSANCLDTEEGMAALRGSRSPGDNKEIIRRGKILWGTNGIRKLMI